jgi:chemotaxis protein CheD
VSSRYTDLQLDALRELANIGSGTAATALSALLGRPALVAMLERMGAARARLRAVLVGGAQMFAVGDQGGTLNVGSRNEQAVRDALSRARITVAAAETGGNCGRTVRVHVVAGLVTVKQAGHGATQLFPPAEAASVAA